MTCSTSIFDCHLGEVPTGAHLLHRQLKRKSYSVVILYNRVDGHLSCFPDQSESLINAKETFHVHDSLVVVKDSSYARDVLLQQIRDVISPQVLLSELLPPQLLAQR